MGVPLKCVIVQTDIDRTQVDILPMRYRSQPGYSRIVTAWYRGKKLFFPQPRITSYGPTRQQC